MVCPRNRWHTWEAARECPWREGRQRLSPENLPKVDRPPALCPLLSPSLPAHIPLSLHVNLPPSIRCCSRPRSCDTNLRMLLFHVLDGPAKTTAWLCLCHNCNLHTSSAPNKAANEDRECSTSSPKNNNRCIPPPPAAARSAPGAPVVILFISFSSRCGRVLAAESVTGAGTNKCDAPLPRPSACEVPAH